MIQTPNRRALAQQQRRAREAAERAAEAVPNPVAAVPNRRTVAQQQRRAREAAERNAPVVPNHQEAPGRVVVPIAPVVPNHQEAAGHAVVPIRKMPVVMFDIMLGTWTLSAQCAARSIGLQKSWLLPISKFANLERAV